MRIPIGSLHACAPAGMFTLRRPSNVTRTLESPTSRAVLLATGRPAHASRITSGVAPKWLLKRTRMLEASLDTMTSWRMVASGAMPWGPAMAPCHTATRGGGASRVFLMAEASGAVSDPTMTAAMATLVSLWIPIRVTVAAKRTPLGPCGAFRGDALGCPHDRPRGSGAPHRCRGRCCGP